MTQEMRVLRYPDLGERDLIRKYDLLTEYELNSLLVTFGHLHQSIQEARKIHVEEKTLENRVLQVLLSNEYATDAFIHNVRLRIPVTISAEWITAALIRTHCGAMRLSKNDMYRRVTDRLMQFSGDSVDMLKDIVAAYDDLGTELTYITGIIGMFTYPMPEHVSLIDFWNVRIKDGTVPIEIAGRDRGVKSARRILDDMRTFRSVRWSHEDGPVDISGDSWMFSRPDSFERVMGEPLESLINNGCNWMGNIDVLNPDHIVRATESGITYVNRIITGSVFALTMKDSFIHTFITTGAYPTIGSFRMPRVTFQNFIA